MRVLLINQAFHPDPQATSQYLGRVALELKQRGHEVTVLSGSRNYDDSSERYPEWEDWNGVEIIRVWQSGLGRGSVKRRLVDFGTFLISALFKGLFLPRADVVVALTSPPLVSVAGAMIARWQRARFVYWVMDLNPDEVVAVGWLRADSALVRFLESASRWSLRQANKVVVLDGYMRDRIVAKGIPTEKIEIGQLWAQEEITFDPAGRERFRRKHGLTDKHVVMYSGNHTPCHPLDTLVEAARLVRDEPKLHFCFIGGGTEWSRLRDRAQSEGWPNATFLGYQPFGELSGSLSAADTQVVVMGDAFVGIVHPCKVYNFLAAKRPFIYIGPEQSHVTDIVKAARIEGTDWADGMAWSFRHGDSHELAVSLKRRLLGGWEKAWLEKEDLSAWSEAAGVEKMVSAILGD